MALGRKLHAFSRPEATECCCMAAILPRSSRWRASSVSTTRLWPTCRIFRQVRAMAQQVRHKHDRIDVLLNNAGVFKVADQKDTRTVDGLDVRIAVNAVAPYILAKDLLPIIPKNQGRIVNISSAGQAPVELQKAFIPTTEGSSPYSGDDFQAYAQSKLAMMMWTNALAQQHPDHTIFSVNPASLIDTKMVKEGFGVASGRNDLSVGADILVEAAVGHKFGSGDASGKYFDNDIGDFGRPHPDCLDRHKNRQLVEALEALLAQQS